MIINNNNIRIITGYISALKYSVFIAVFILCVIISSGIPLYASGTVGTSGADFLEICPGSRSLAMGEAFTAQPGDIHTLYYNPAGLGTMVYPVLSMQHQELIMDSRYEYVGASYPLGEGTIAASNSLFWVPAFDKVDIDGNTTGKVKYYNGATTLGYGTDFGFAYFGGSVKYVYQQIDTLFVQSVALDLGVMKGMYLYSPFDVPSQNFYMGLSVLNIGTKAKDDPLPRMLRLGASYRLFRWLGFNVDMTENLIDFSDTYDFVSGFDESFRVNAGVEFNYREMVALRGGYRFNDGGTYTFGLGFNFVVGEVAFMLDTHYAETGVFGPNYSFNVSFKLVPRVITIEDKRQAEIHYRRGLKYFIANDYQSALYEFRLCKDFNPYHRGVDSKIEDIEEILKLQRENIELDKELQKFR